MTVRGFRYALEPVRLTRQWALDGLLAELRDAQTELAQRQQELGRLTALAQAAQVEWNALGPAGQAMPAERFAQLSCYLADCRRRQQAQADVVRQAERVLDDVQQSVMAARRELDAVEKHRADASRHVQRQRQDGAIKAADELWSVLKAGRGNHDSND